MWLTRQSVVFSSLLASAAALSEYVHDGSFRPDAILRITHQTVSVGGISKPMTLVNGSVPGPALHIPEDKVVWIRVYNDMDHDNVTMHWHGLAQAAYPFSDGSPLASQWPIPPQHYFDYELKTAKGTAGTYFYHSHVGLQASTANGPLIVDDPGPAPYKYDGDRIIHLGEIFRLTDDEIVSSLINVPFRWPGDPLGWLINGKTIVPNATDASSAKLHVIHVDPAKTYRFRFIGSTGLGYASLAFQNHTKLQVIEADGHYTMPYATELLQVGSGQRFSTLFTSKSCSELRKLGALDFYMQIESRDRPVVTTSYAVLRYRNTCNMSVPRVSTSANPGTPPLTLPPTINGFLDYKLQPLEDNGFPSAAEVSRRIIINSQLVGNGYFIWQSNNASWTEDGDNPIPVHTIPQEPYLVSLYKNKTQYLPDYSAAVQNGGLDPKTKTYPAKLGEVIEIVLQQRGASPGGSLDTHPWHAHGVHFYDLGGGEGAYDPEAAEAKLRGTRPVQRDTTMLFRYTNTTTPGQIQGWRAWRLRVEAAGVWMVHCHTLHHMVQGMQTVWIFGNGTDILRVGLPEVTGYLDYGGNVNGNLTHPARVLHFHDLESGNGW